jgi:hypothetical protein
VPRGGRRPGAGAPAGNLNALKHGAHSTYIHALVQALAAHPTTREALIRLARRRRAQKREAERAAALLLSALLDKTLRSLRPVLSNAEGDNQTEEDRANTDRLLHAVLQRNNQTPDTDRRKQSGGSGFQPLEF